MVILVVLVLDVVVDARDLLYASSVIEASPFVYYKCLLKRSNDLAQGFICPVFDFVPMEGFQILFSRL